MGRRAVAKPCWQKQWLITQQVNCSILGFEWNSEDGSLSFWYLYSLHDIGNVCKVAYVVFGLRMLCLVFCTRFCQNEVYLCFGIPMCSNDTVWPVSWCLLWPSYYREVWWFASAVEPSN
jgi:hypothetical protein